MKAGWIKHRIPTFGFVIEQKELQGKLDTEGLKKIGIMPGPVYKKIKMGESVYLDNGQLVNSLNFFFYNYFWFETQNPVFKLDTSLYVGPSRQGKKITILGDCFECSESLIGLACNSDVLVHEATLENAFKEKAVSNGHSTPSKSMLSVFWMDSIDYTFKNERHGMLRGESHECQMFDT